MIYIYIYIYYFILCEIKNLFCFTCISTHAFMCLLSVTGIYRLIQLCCYLHLQLIDSG